MSANVIHELRCTHRLHIPGLYEYVAGTEDDSGNKSFILSCVILGLNPEMPVCS